MEACEAVVLSPGTSESGTGSRAGAPAEKQPMTWRRVPRFPWRPVVSLPAAGSAGARGSHRPPQALASAWSGPQGARGAPSLQQPGPCSAWPLMSSPPGRSLGKDQRSESQAAWGGPGSLHSCSRGPGPGPCAGRQREQLPEARSASCAEPRSRGRLRALGASGRGPDLVGGQEPCPGRRWRPHPAATKSQACFREDPRRRPGPTGWRTQTS